MTGQEIDAFAHALADADTANDYCMVLGFWDDDDEGAGDALMDALSAMENAELDAMLWHREFGGER